MRLGFDRRCVSEFSQSLPFFGPQHCVPYNSNVPNDWLCLFPLFTPGLPFPPLSPSVHLSKTWCWTCSCSEAGFLGLAGCVRKGTGVVRENMCSYVTVQLGTPRASSVSSFIVHLNFIKENYHKLQQVSRDLLTALEAFSFSASLKTQGRKEVVTDRPQHWH